MADDITLINGDCLDAEFPRTHFVITDPPYGIAYQSNRKRDKTERFDVLENDDRADFSWLDKVQNAIMQPAALFVFCRWDVQFAFYEAIARYWRIRSQVIWDRGVHGLGDLNSQYAPCHDVCWFATQGDYMFPNGRPKSIYHVDRVPANALLHPTQKPLALMQIIVSDLTRVGDLVVDPFMGSGTTAIACAKLQRKFWGCEIDAKYYDIARRRVAEANQQRALFE